MTIVITVSLDDEAYKILGKLPNRTRSNYINNLINNKDKSLDFKKIMNNYNKDYDISDLANHIRLLTKFYDIKCEDIMETTHG